MKSLKFLAPALLLFQIASAASASNTKPVPSSAKPQLGTSFRFTGSSLHGKYQTSLGSTATVENDKYLEDLLGARKNFDDRIKRDSDRN